MTMDRMSVPQERIREDKRYIFERITVRMIDNKPYYEIEYIDNGERMTGYGSYSITVISDYLKQYFILQSGYERHDVQTEENMQLTDLREEQEERIVASPIIHPLKGE